MSRSLSFGQLGRGLCIGLALAVTAAGAVFSQTSTGSIRGYVKDANGAPLGGAVIEARNEQSGVSRTTNSQADGSYALPGLVPAAYNLTARQIGHTAQGRRVVVQIGASLLVDFALQAGAVEVAGVTVQAAAPVSETRTSEVATNVTQQQIERLPTQSRNFLDLAALAPGVIISEDRVNLSANNTTPRNFSSGAQGPGEVNVFIDGASLKNDLTGGESAGSGIAGQDNSRGNPFPRNAIQEYRVVTQNFKAEYQKASSAIISATTKSGGSVWTGNAFFGYQNNSLVALDSFQRAANFTKPDYTRYLVGLSAGGPLTHDHRLRFFGSYEGNYQNRANTVSITPDTFTALKSIPFASFNGNFRSPFRETLLFGKLSYDATPQSSIELSTSIRHEYDIRNFGNNQAFQDAINWGNDVDFGTLKHSYFTGSWLNEASVTYERFRRTQVAAFPGIPQQQFGFATLGSYETNQDFTQKRLGFRDDVTYTGFHAGGSHAIKLGTTLDLLSYDVNKGNNESPLFVYGDSVNCNPNCVGNESYAFKNPYKLVWAAGNPFLSAHNAQLGVYAQDDWSPTPRLTLNVGIRWDYESHMLNYDYVTPRSVRDTIRLYNSQLYVNSGVPHPIDTLEYFTDGTQRKRFLGAFQPRLGFSYALDHDSKTTLFGGIGIFYDRSYFDLSIDETLKLTHPQYAVYFAPRDSTTPRAGQIGWNDSYLTTNAATLQSIVASGKAALGEAWLIGNHTKPPRSTQWNVGVRRLFGDYLVSVAYAGVRSVNGLVFNWANHFWKNFGTDSSACCGGTEPFHGFQNIIYSTNSVKTWYDALQIQATRPYRKTGVAGWGAGLTYTYSTRSLQGIDNPDDELAFPQAVFIPKHPSNDEKSRVVANWTLDIPYAYGVQFSGLITLGSGPRYDIAGRFDPARWVPGGFAPQGNSFLIPNAWAYRDVDLRLRKDFPSVSGTTLGITVDVFNAFNYQNYGCFNTGPQPNPNFGQQGCVVSDPRRAQIGAEYNF
jgi:outer membrane receptor protein involved in Fe transport